MPTFCFKCGSQHAVETFPKKCPCGYIHWKDPAHSYVGILLIPYDGGLLGILRGIAPKIGGIAFPGGFAAQHETLKQAAIREAFEETGLVIDEEDVSFFDERISDDGHNLEFFIASENVCTRLPLLSDVPDEFVHETQGFVVIRSHEEMCFPKQAEIARRFFKGERRWARQVRTTARHSLSNTSRVKASIRPKRSGSAYPSASRDRTFCANSTTLPQDGSK